ncbi:MAG: oxidoreductase C-terminal domain-containing protein [Gemmatimonadota bacterium]
MLDRGAPYAPVPSFWSDQYGLRMQHVGLCAPEDEVVLRGRLDEDSWTAFYVREGVLRAAFGVNRFRDVNAARRLIEREARVDSAALADDSTDLRDLARRMDTTRH